MTRTTDVFAGLSWVTSAAVVVQANVVETEFMNWLIKAVIAGAIAITGYYLRDTAKTIKETKERTESNSKALDDHDLIIGLWIESLGKELDERGGNIGRRHTDRALGNLVTAMRRIHERRESGDKE